jgi:hypothetical protein
LKRFSEMSPASQRLEPDPIRETIRQPQVDREFAGAARGASTPVHAVAAMTDHP